MKVEKASLCEGKSNEPKVPVLLEFRGKMEQCWPARVQKKSRKKGFQNEHNRDRSLPRKSQRKTTTKNHT